MRTAIPLLCVLILGCGPSAHRTPQSAAALAGDAPAEPEPPLSDQHPQATAAASDALPPDLGTRKSGNDWPCFLGPTGDSVSSEKGIVAPWPKEGLRLVWQRNMAEGYAMPSISRGRLFLFDRVQNKARLVCLKSETGDLLWTFTYPTEFRDNYGYSGGPRCCPVVDGDRVYIYGSEGMLHCLKAADGRLVWKVDALHDFGVIDRFFGVAGTPSSRATYSWSRSAVVRRAVRTWTRRL